MFDIKFSILDKIRPLIDQAKELEKSLHRSRTQEKDADQTIQMANDADLGIDEDMQYELAEQLGKKAASRAGLEDSRLDEFKYDSSHHKKRDSKAVQKEKALKQKYDQEIQHQKLKKFSNSSFLTPEAAMYLNEAIRDNQTKVDDEIIYAGLHGDRVDKMKFERKNAKQARYRSRSKKRYKKGKFG